MLSVKILIPVLCLINIPLNLITGQSAEMFLGGFGNGYSTDEIIQNTIIVSTGGNGDGYSSEQIINSELVLSFGGNGDGYTKDELLNIEKTLSFGGNGDAHTVDSITGTDRKLISMGGDGDGYTRDNLFRMIWKGFVSTDWSEPDNWSSNRVPDINDHVEVNNGSPHFPNLNNQLLYVGIPTQTNLLHCKSLDIGTNGMIEGTNFGRIDNLGNITVAGIIHFTNTMTFPIRNFSPGIIEILNGGEIRLEQN